MAASKHFEECMGIEISALNVESAKLNAGVNGINNCAFAAGDATDIFAQVSTGRFS